MQTVEESLISAREAKNISLKTASEALHIKMEILESLEKGDWENLPEPPFLKGFLTTYAKFLNLDPTHILALYRREFDESKHLKSRPKKKKAFMFTPKKAINITFLLCILVFVTYLFLQYFSILSAPKLTIYSPQEDSTTTVPVVEISGQTDKDATVSVAGEIVLQDAQGNFKKEVNLSSGENNIEVIASRKLSPKTRNVITVRLID